MTTGSTKLILPAISLCSLTNHNIVGLGLAIGLPVLLGYAASSHVRKFKPLYYRDVIKPRFMPPNWVYAPVWTILYTMMGYASYLIYKTGDVHNISTLRPLSFYGIQLSLNLCWPALFFRYRNPKVALFIITSNLLTASVTATKFYNLNEEAGLIMVPYLIWLTIGGYLNKLIWRLNQNNVKLTKRQLFTYPSDAEIFQAELDLNAQLLSSTKKAE